jgi:hypothetical protein
MFLASEELTLFIVTNQGVGVRYSSGPIELLPVHFAHKRACAFMTAANP